MPTTGPGVRRQPYSFDFAIDPLTLADYNGDTFPQQNNSEVHNAGEIWASALWDMSWLLIEKYGFDQDIFTGNGGNNIAMSIVIVSGPNPPKTP